MYCSSNINKFFIGCDTSMAPNLRFCVTNLGFGNSSRNKAREHWKYTIEGYEQAEGLLSIIQAARLYIISKTILYHRINGRNN